MFQNPNVSEIENHAPSEKNRPQMATRILQLLNFSDKPTDTIGDMLSIIRQDTGIEAVGIRLREGEDFPYYETRGFPAAFVKQERSICRRDQSGNIIRDPEGFPQLECMCGCVICGRTRPGLPFFTEGGSFWTNSTNELATTFTEEVRQIHPRYRCRNEGYESVSLIPLRSNNETIGLLQLNDHRKGMFSDEMIRAFEKIGASIGRNIMRERTERALKKSEETVQALLNASIEAMILVDINGIIHAINAVAAEKLGKPQEELIGRCSYDFFSNDVAKFRKERVEEVIRSRKPVRFEDRRNGRTFDQNMYPLIDEDGKVDRIAIFIRDITQRRKAELRLKKNEQLLATSNKKFAELTNALDILIKTQKHGQKKLEEKILLNVNKIIIPYIEKLKRSHLSSQHISYLEIIETQLKEIISPFVRHISSQYINLTPTEIRIANLIKKGRITKEIAELLNVSDSAILFHRHNIRRKLGLKGKKINLRSYFQTVP